MLSHNQQHTQWRECITSLYYLNKSYTRDKSSNAVFNKFSSFKWKQNLLSWLIKCLKEFSYIAQLQDFYFRSYRKQLTLVESEAYLLSFLATQLIVSSLSNSFTQIFHSYIASRCTDNLMLMTSLLLFNMLL